MFKGSDKNCDKSQIKYHFINMSIFQFPFTCLGTCCKERIVYCQVKSLEVCTFVTFYLNIFCSQFIFYQGFCKGIQSKLSNETLDLALVRSPTSHDVCVCVFGTLCSEWLWHSKDSRRVCPSSLTSHRYFQFTSI